MTLTIHTLPLLVALAVVAFMRWSELLLDLPGRLLARARARRLRAELEREVGGWILPIAGVINAAYADEVLDGLACRLDAAARMPHPPLYVLIDTPGGACDAAERILRRVSMHQGLVVAVVPHRAWSNGTLIATGADRLEMGPDAHLGPCCPIGHIDPTDLHSAAVERAREQNLTVDQIRAEWMARQAKEAIVDARVRRVSEHADASRLADALAGGELGSHWRPIFPEVAASIGFKVTPIAPEQFRKWSDLARAMVRALPIDRR